MVSVCKVELAATVYAAVTLVKVYALLVSVTALPSTVKLALYPALGVIVNVWFAP